MCVVGCTAFYLSSGTRIAKSTIIIIPCKTNTRKLFISLHYYLTLFYERICLESTTFLSLISHVYHTNSNQIFQQQLPETVSINFRLEQLSHFNFFVSCVSLFLVLLLYYFDEFFYFRFLFCYTYLCKCTYNANCI